MKLFRVPFIGILAFALALFGAGCVRQAPRSQQEAQSVTPSNTPVDPSNKSESQRNTQSSGSESASPAGSCIPFEPYPGYTTCLMSEPQSMEHPTDKFGKDEAQYDNNEEEPHQESDDPDPARD